MPRGVYKRTPRTPEHNAAISNGMKNSDAVKAKADNQRGSSLPPETCAVMSVAHIGVPNTGKAAKGVPKPPEHCAAISRGLTGLAKTGKAAKGVPKSHEHCMAISDAKICVPLSPEHIAAGLKGREEAGVYDAMRGGNDIVNHHYIYDHFDLSKYIMKMTRSRHGRLHRMMQISGIIVPHINRGI